MLSITAWPKVITLSGVSCSSQNNNHSHLKFTTMNLNSFALLFCQGKHVKWKPLNVIKDNVFNGFMGSTKSQVRTAENNSFT
jgi:hypothetical protein